MAETCSPTMDETSASLSHSTSVEKETKPDSNNSLVDNEQAYSFLEMFFILVALILCVFLVTSPPLSYLMHVLY